MKTTTPEPSKPEDKSKFKREMEVTEIIHDALLSVDPDRRGPIIMALAMLLKIYIPRD